MKARKSANMVRFQLACAAAWLACCGPLPQSAGGAVLDLGALFNSGSTTSEGRGITDTGRATGISDQKAFRTATNSAIYDYPQSGDNVHNTLTQLLPFPVISSFAFDIWQASGSTQIELVGQYNNNSINRAYWYYESANGKTKYARILYDSTGAANAVKPDSGVGGASAVVGFVQVNGKNAAYWSVIPTNHWLYNFGQIYFPNEDSEATDTDRNRTVGFRGNDPLFHAFIIDGAAYALTEPPGAVATVAFGMFTTGSVSKVVGYSLIGSQKKPILWSYDGNGLSSYTLLTLPLGLSEGVARGINDAGDIVGSAWTSGQEVACRWNYSGSVIVLNNYSGDTNWNLVQAYKVSSTAGGRKIVGVGWHTNGGSALMRGFVFN